MKTVQIIERADELGEQWHNGNHSYVLDQIIGINRRIDCMALFATLICEMDDKERAQLAFVLRVKAAS
jgi:hypothetical protein